MAARTDPRVDAYLGRSGAFAQPVLRHLRNLVHTACPEVVESIKWGHVSFSYGGKILAFMAAFKAHAAFGFWHKDMKRVLARDGHRAGDAMGLMGRITGLADLPDDQTILRYLKTAVSLHDSGTPARPRPRPKPKIALRLPADLAAALKRNKAAAAGWKNLSYSHRKEYRDWLTEAKRVETRSRRLATTLQWLAAGKSRHWKYANC